MKFSIKTRALADAFKLCSQVAPTKSPKDILKNVKLSVVRGELTLTATDTEIGIRTKLTEDLDVSREGSVLMPVAKTSAILGELTDESLEIETKDTHTVLKSARSKFQLLAADVAEFPDVHPELGPKHSLVNVRALEKAFLRTVFCADTESTRYALGGIHLTEDGDKLAVIGTDGRRLAIQAIDCTSIAHHRFDDGCCLIPERAARMLLRACNRSKGEALIAASINDAIFDFGDCQLVTRMVEGRYPNWRQVIPKVVEYSTANFFVGPLLAAVRQAAIATGPDSKGIEFTFASGALRLHAQDSAIGESTVEIPCECDVEQAVTSKLDHTFVREFLSVLNPDSNCKMEFRGKNDPILASTDDGYRYVIMPMANERV